MARTRDEAEPRLDDGGTGRLGVATAVLAGAVGGLYGVAAMSVLRLALHRAGLIDKMVPQVVEEWISDRLNTDPPGGQAGHHVADQLLHLGYGASLGALGGPMLSGREPAVGCGAERPSGWRAGPSAWWFWSLLCAWRARPGARAPSKT